MNTIKKQSANLKSAENKPTISDSNKIRQRRQMNTSSQYNPDDFDFTQPIRLQYDNKKFWEVILNADFLMTNVRCGKITNGLIDESNTPQEASKIHDSLEEAKQYIMKHASLKFGKGYKKMPKTSQINTNLDSSSAKSSKSKTAYMIKILPPVEEKLKNTSLESNPLKRKAPEDLVNPQLRRGKPETGNKPSIVKKFQEISRGDTIELNEEVQPTLLIDVEEGSKSDFSYRSGFWQGSKKGSDTNESSNFSNGGNPRPAIYNRTKKTEEFKGDYLELTDARGQLKSFTIQVSDKYAKIETRGPRNDASDVTYTQHIDAQDAISEAQKAITKKIAEGYRKVPNKFVFSFEIAEATAGREDLIITQNPRGNTNQSAPSSPRHIPTNQRRTSNSQTNSPRRLSQRDLDPLLLGVQIRDDYSQTSRRASDYDDDDDFIDMSLFVDDPPRKDDSNSGSKKDLISEPNKDHSLGKPISQPYSSLLLAQKWDDNIDPTGYYMSEKLDGVRCLWTGSVMYSRNNKRYYPPKFFTKDFPGSPLDGELWIGRSTFQKCVSVVRKQTPVDNEWRLVQFLVFDAPALNLPFSQRIKKLEEFFTKIDSPYIKLHKHEICTGPEQLMREHERVEQMGGEGMMLRDPNSFYENRRSKTLLKVKKFDDDEAVVLAHEPGNGRCAGMMGAIRVRNTQGVEFSIGSGFNDAQRRKPPKIGIKVTYKYQGVSTSNVPRFPIFLRIFEEP